MPMDNKVDLTGILSKRSGTVFIFLWFLVNMQEAAPHIIYAGAAVSIAYMILDGIKTWMDR